MNWSAKKPTPAELLAALIEEFPNDAAALRRFARERQIDIPTLPPWERDSVLESVSETEGLACSVVHPPCSECGETIKMGEIFHTYTDGTWVHERCANHEGES